MAFFEVSNFAKDFGETKVLKDVSFSMEKGEVLAIIGSSGSGKTTLLRCINFLERPDNGKMTIDDEVISNIDRSEFFIEDVEISNHGNAAVDKVKNHRKQAKLNVKIRKSVAKNEKENLHNRLHFGLVFQSFNLFPHLNVINNILIAVDAQNKRIINDLKKQKKTDKSLSKKQIATQIKEKRQQLRLAEWQNADDLLEKVGLTIKKNSYPCELSGGQQQRVAIARALALNPDILCFDEPTSALDPELTEEVLKVIKELRKSKMTMIIVTHEMEFAKNVADNVIFMKDGVIAEMGKAKIIFDNPQTDDLRAFLRKSEINYEKAD